MNDEFNKGFDELEMLIENYAKAASEEEILEVLEVGAKEFVRILLKLPKPRSKINKAGYTHLIDSFSYRKNKNQIEVGWGKYYGPIIEKKDHPHLKPTFEKNKDYIYKKMLEKAWKGI